MAADRQYSSRKVSAKVETYGAKPAIPVKSDSRVNRALRVEEKPRGQGRTPIGKAVQEDG